MATLLPTFFSHGLLLLLLLLFAFALPGRCLHAKEEVLSRQHTFDIRSLLTGDNCSSSKVLKGTDEQRLNLVHQHGPCSPLHGKKNPSHKQLLNKDQSRVDWIHHKISSSTSKQQDKLSDSLTSASIPARSGSSLGTGNYVVSIGIGTPKRDFSVIFDTGSDVTWIQCKPCVAHCYVQQDQLFDPLHSSTYANISCRSPYCSQLDSHGCNASGCLYAVQYGDGSYTVGFYAQDTLTLTPSNVIPNFRFGCGENNRGLFGQAAGLLGLGGDKPSLVSQAYQKYGGVFSYCIPPTASSIGYLAFGGSSASSYVKYTPLLTDPNTPTFYFVTLIAISVGGQQLSISPTVFSTAGTIIDSGTVITRLPPDAYSALRSAFRQKMSSYKSAPALSILDTCYDFSGYNNVKIPAVALRFDGGVVVDLDVSGIMYVASSSQACLAFAGNSDPADTAIYGNVQQKTFNVVYDVSEKVIGFGPGGC